MITFQILKTSDIEITCKMMRDFYAIDNYAIDIEISKKLFKDFIADENLGKSYLICHSDIEGVLEIVGYTIMTFVFSFEYKGKIAFIDELYIKESHRGRGIGSKTLQFLKNESHKLKLKLIYLEVENHNLKAQKLYIANDFEFHNRKIMRYKV